MIIDSSSVTENMNLNGLLGLRAGQRSYWLCTFCCRLGMLLGSLEPIGGLLYAVVREATEGRTFFKQRDFEEPATRIVRGIAFLGVLQMAHEIRRIRTAVPCVAVPQVLISSHGIDKRPFCQDRASPGEMVSHLVSKF